MSKIDEIIKSGKFPGVRGNSKGPGNGANEVVFHKMDLDKEFNRMARMMEDDGKLKDPVTMKAIMAIKNDIDSRPEKEKKRDFQVDGIHA